MGRKYSCVTPSTFWHCTLLMNTNICLKCKCHALNALTKRKPSFLPLPGGHSEATTLKIRLRAGLRWGAYDAPSNLLSPLPRLLPWEYVHYLKWSQRLCREETRPSLPLSLSQSACGSSIFYGSASACDVVRRPHICAFPAVVVPETGATHVTDVYKRHSLSSPAGSRRSTLSKWRRR